ncbi:MAG: aminopeptidase P family protein [Ilumatobacteraceae bacterium]|nr:aminopeptidase P family protein [Ilumatobacteraceae bacterium]
MIKQKEFAPIDVRDRVLRTSQALTSHNLRWILLHDLTNIQWLTGFSGSAATVLMDTQSATLHLFTDGRYVEQAQQQTKDAQAVVQVHRVSTVAERCQLIATLVTGATVYVGSTDVTIALFDTIQEHLLVEATQQHLVFAELRRVKDAPEMERINHAAAIADRALQSVVSAGLCGLTEKQIRNEIDRTMQDLGADGASFDTIVATGANAALPHHRPDATVVLPGHLVVIDMGALVDGYHSDMTRTIKVGEPSPDDLVVFDVVCRSQAAGVEAVAAGVTALDIDSVCRSVINEAGYGQYFTHGTGHGVGLVIHEEPFINDRSRQVLLAGEVVTVEPGVYRGGVSGVRIEDLVEVTSNGCRIVSQTPKDLSCPPFQRTISKTA